VIAVSAADLEWTDKALCAEVDSEIFFPRKGEATEQAKAVCRSCEARIACLRFSIDATDREGIYGGFSMRVRKRIERDHAAGKSLEDIIAEDDARFYAKAEKQAEKERKERKYHQDRRAANRAAASAPQSRRTAA
jgi:WhiB family transcriptional regulator, redox-sensing transcriptional regulator